MDTLSPSLFQTFVYGLSIAQKNFLHREKRDFPLFFLFPILPRLTQHFQLRPEFTGEQQTGHIHCASHSGAAQRLDQRRKAAALQGDETAHHKGAQSAQKGTDKDAQRTFPIGTEPESAAHSPDHQQKVAHKGQKGTPGRPLDSH
ncbi:hypothetical protein DW741_04890 [Ruminococcaceae bacterium AM28-23LB]|nr:hypothetical protein DW741_04890 [Ruminococcaceae bacterium AM28-23LB]